MREHYLPLTPSTGGPKTVPGGGRGGPQLFRFLCACAPQTALGNAIFGAQKGPTNECRGGYFAFCGVPRAPPNSTGKCHFGPSKPRGFGDKKNKKNARARRPTALGTAIFGAPNMTSFSSFFGNPCHLTPKHCTPPNRAGKCHFWGPKSTQFGSKNLPPTGLGPSSAQLGLQVAACGPPNDPKTFQDTPRLKK